jgi:ATP-dependent helicase/nuclease subunit B
VLFKGNFDRIDQIGDAIRIIDYKTGVVKDSDLYINLEQLEKNPKALQLLFYQYLFFKDQRFVANNRTQKDKVVCGMISFKKLNQGLFSLTLDKRPLEELNDDCFETLHHFLVQWIEELYGKETPIMHNPDSKYCEFCG